jgi:hypothetical protein
VKRFDALPFACNRAARLIATPSAIVLITLCLAYFTSGAAWKTWATSKATSFHNLAISDEISGPDDLAASIPFDASLPEDAVASRTTANPALSRWLANAVSKDLNIVRERILLSGGSFDTQAHIPQINAVLVDARSQIRAMVSNARSRYFGSDALPVASTGKIFVALALGRHDSPDAQYCSPLPVTSWQTIDAVLSTDCGTTGRMVSARAAFARSMPRPILWRSFQTLSEDELRNVFQQLGITNLNYPSLIASATFGSIKVPPVYLHRAALAITLAFAGRRESAQTPTLIEEVTTGNPPHLQPVARPAISVDQYDSVIENDARAYASDILAAPFRQGTLHELVDFTDRGEIMWLWGKTGTYAVNGNTKHIWIVGGLVVNGEPYSYLVLAAAPDADHSFGNANASVFAPLAGDLIEAAIHDDQSK